MLDYKCYRVWLYTAPIYYALLLYRNPPIGTFALKMDLNLAQSGVFLDESIVKTDKRRFVKLPQNLADTLPSYFKIHNPNSDARIFKWQHHIAQRYLNEIFKAANVKRIRNGIRHTAASYHLAQSGSAFKSAEQLGNSARILKIHYTGNVTKKQCKQFYSLDLTKPSIETL